MIDNNSDAHRSLVELAEVQHGLVSRRQARETGLTRSALVHRIARGDWTPVGKRVLRRSGSPPSDEMTAMAGVLDAGPSSYVAAHSAVAMWGAPGFRVEPVQVITLRRDLPVDPLATIHVPRHLPDPFATVLRGVPIVRPALALLEVALLIHPQQLARLFDWFWTRRLLSGPSVAAELADLMHKGRPGTAAMRALLDGLPEGYVPAASGLESRFGSIVTDHGLPAMRRQVDLGDGERWCGRVDFLAADLPLVVEIDSETYHSALTSRADDAVRQARLEAAGFRVVRVTAFEVWHRRDVVVARIRHAVAEIWAERAA